MICYWSAIELTNKWKNKENLPLAESAARANCANFHRMFAMEALLLSLNIDISYSYIHIVVTTECVGRRWPLYARVLLLVSIVCARNYTRATHFSYEIV